MKTKPTRPTKRIKKVIPTNKTKPIVIQSEVTRQSTPKITIIVSGGCVQDILKERCTNTEVEIHDYDIEGLDVESRDDCLQDKNGDTFQVIKF